MQAFYETTFERDMGSTINDFRRNLPDAFAPLDVRWPAGPHGDTARVLLNSGVATIDWRGLPPRVIGLVSLPRVHVRFAFDGTDPAEWQRVMKRFDLVMLRGGG